METTIRRIGDSKDLLGESPCWDARAGCVWWIDSLGGVVRRLRVEPDLGTDEIHRLPAPIGSIALCEEGGILVALKDRFGRYDPATGQLETLATIDVDHPDVRLNDGKCDAWGN